MAQSNVIGIINKLKIPRWIYSDGVPVALTDPQTGLVVPQTNTVANEAALQAIPKVSANDCLTVFVSGMGAVGMFWIYRHSTGMWHVPFPQLLYNLFFGSIASPSCIIGDGVTVATLFNVGTTVKIPAGMLRVGSQLRIAAEIAKTQGATHSSAVGTIYMGANGSSADSSMAAGTIADADKSTLPMQPRIRVVDTGRITTTYSSGYSAGSSGVDGILDKTTGIAVASDMFVTVGMGAKAANDIYKLLMLQVWIDAI
ncbi:MAG: hypothetical protein JNL77_07000 [Nitrosomonas sp.]|nr:hypothetical protein [Nitrosomonas sp.]